jgi:hypothetical protein
MIVPVPYVLGGLGALLSVTSVPLILRKVPMNRAYGVRIAKAFVSDENWYAVNEYGGKLLLGFGLFLLVFALLTRDLAPEPTDPRAPLYLIVPLLGLVPVGLLIHAFARRLPDR